MANVTQTTESSISIHQNKTATRGPSLTNLPAEIHLKLVDILEANKDPETTACLGLTCKRFYPMFTTRYSKTPLTRSCKECKTVLDSRFRVRPLLALCKICEVDRQSYTSLHVLLQDWIPKSLVSGKQLEVDKFLTLKRFIQLLAKYIDDLLEETSWREVSSMPPHLR